MHYVIVAVDIILFNFIFFFEFYLEVENVISCIKMSENRLYLNSFE